MKVNIIVWDPTEELLHQWIPESLLIEIVAEKYFRNTACNKIVQIK